MVSITSGHISSLLAPCPGGGAKTEPAGALLPCVPRQRLEAVLRNRPLGRVGGSGGGYSPGWRQMNPRTVAPFEVRWPFPLQGLPSRPSPPAGLSGAPWWGLCSSFKALSPVPPSSHLLSLPESSGSQPEPCLSELGEFLPSPCLTAPRSSRNLEMIVFPKGFSAQFLSELKSSMGLPPPASSPLRGQG